MGIKGPKAANNLLLPSFAVSPVVQEDHYQHRLDGVPAPRVLPDQLPCIRFSSGRIDGQKN